jgi:hypothetical protein
MKKHKVRAFFCDNLTQSQGNFGKKSTQSQGIYTSS